MMTNDHIEGKLTNEPRRHHFIPVFYLKRWRMAGRPKLVEFSHQFGDKLRSRWVAPKSTGFVDRLYEMRGLAPEISQQVETEFLSPVDAAAARAMALLEKKHYDWGLQERDAWAKFLTNLQVRHPDELAGIVRHLSIVARREDSALADAYQKFCDEMRKNGATNLPQSLDEYIRLQDKNASIQASLRAMMNVTDSDRISKIIRGMRWGSAHLPWNTHVILTSDRPLHVTASMLHPDCQIWLPIGPHAVFYAVSSADAERRLDEAIFADPNRFVFYLNKMTVRRATRYVWSVNDGQRSFIEKYMSTDVIPSLGDRVAAKFAAQQ